MTKTKTKTESPLPTREERRVARDAKVRKLDAEDAERKVAREELEQKGK